MNASDGMHMCSRTSSGDELKEIEAMFTPKIPDGFKDVVDGGQASDWHARGHGGGRRVATGRAVPIFQ